MKKPITVTIAALTAFALSGCTPAENKSSLPEQSSSASSIQSEDDAVSETSSAPVEKIPDGEPTFLIGLDGKPIYTSELTHVSITENGEERETAFSELSESDDFSVTCDGFAYAQLPNGKNYNSAYEPGMFKDDLYRGEDLINENPINRIEVGDTICGLTVKSARTIFKQGNYPQNFFDKYFSRCEVEFSGEVTLTGYADVTMYSEFYLDASGDMSFNADKESDVLPIISFCAWGKNDRLYIHPYTSQKYLYNDSVCIELGNINEMDADHDFDYGESRVRVKITIDNIRMQSDSMSIQAHLKSIERLW